METLEKEVVALFKEEHQDWVKHIKDAEEQNEGVDINLGGNFAERLEKLLTALRNFRERNKKKGKGLFRRG